VSQQPLVLIALGLIVLVVGAELLVRGSVRLAAAAGLSPMVIGLTVVSLGTSSPELGVSLQAALAGDDGLAIGNVIGSSIFNLTFLLGIGAVVTPLLVKQRLVRIDVPILIGLVAVLWVMSLDGRIGRLEGLLLLAGGVGYSILVVRAEGAESPDVRAEYDRALQEAGGRSLVPLGRAAFLVVLGLAGLIAGGHWMVEGAAQMARDLGIDELIIGLTIVAIGTGLPEIAATVLAAMRREPDLAVGNAIGSSIYNVLIVLGVCAAAAPRGLSVAPSGIWFDIPVLSLAALLCVPVFLWGGRVTRGEGLLLLAFYLGYLGILVRTARLQTALTGPSPDLAWFLVPPLAFLGMVFLEAGLRRRRNRTG
jgi:cation:H+ antiporter